MLCLLLMNRSLGRWSALEQPMYRNVAIYRRIISADSVMVGSASEEGWCDRVHIEQWCFNLAPTSAACLSMRLLEYFQTARARSGNEKSGRENERFGDIVCRHAVVDPRSLSKSIDVCNAELRRNATARHCNGEVCAFTQPGLWGVASPTGGIYDSVLDPRTL
jgi:hypothetical protein